MTEVTPATAAPKRLNVTAWLALLLSVMALAVVVCPDLQAKLPWHSNTVDIAPLEKDVVALNARLDAVNQKVDEKPAAAAAPEIPADIADRLGKLEEKAQSSDATVAAQSAKLQQTAHLPSALALVRVEDRFERGQDFTAALVLAQKLLSQPLDDETNKALEAASHGVPTAGALVQQLDDSERAVRRAIRLAGVDNPLDRIWAELQSLILIKRLNEQESDVVGRALASLRTALQTDDDKVLATAWEQMPSAGQTVLATWKNDVDKRLAARHVLDTLINATLAE